MPASVVLPAPCRPASMMIVGGFLAKFNGRSTPWPSTSVSSSLTILTTCCAGLSASDTSVPSARSRMRAVKERTTSSATSASSSARRISRIVPSISASESLPLLFRCLNAFESRSVKELKAAIMRTSLAVAAENQRAVAEVARTATERCRGASFGGRGCAWDRRGRAAEMRQNRWPCGRWGFPHAQREPTRPESFVSVTMEGQ